MLLCAIVKHGATQQEGNVMYDENEELIDAVIEQIREDASKGDFTAVEALIETLDTNSLLNFLPEEKQADFLQ